VLVVDVVVGAAVVVVDVVVVAPGSVVVVEVGAAVVDVVLVVLVVVLVLVVEVLVVVLVLVVEVLVVVSAPTTLVVMLARGAPTGEHTKPVDPETNDRLWAVTTTEVPAPPLGSTVAVISGAVAVTPLPVKVV